MVLPHPPPPPLVNVTISSNPAIIIPTAQLNFCATLRFAGYVCKRVGKITLSAIGGGILLIQVCTVFNYSHK